MITIENIGKEILLFGRRENKEAYIEKILSFSPYFYIQDEKGSYTSIDGKKLRKIECRNPKDVKIMREGYLNHYEADIIYVCRYIIDRMKELPKEEIRICYLDIETKRNSKGEFALPQIADGEILAIGLYDNFDKEHVNYCSNYNCQDEREVIKKFIKFIKEKDPDVIVSWFGDSYDFPYLIKRIENLGISTKELSRMKGDTFSFLTPNGDFKNKIFGRVLFDLVEGYKKMNPGGRESWSLEYVSNYEGLGGKEKYKGELDDLYKEDIEKFVSYNKRDVELIVLLNEKLRILDFFDEVRRLCFCRIEDVFFYSKVADCLCLKHAREHGFVLPSVRHNIKEKYEGGFVHETEPKLHTNIAWTDMRSLYPSIIIGANISYETLLKEKEEGCINIDNKIFFRNGRGMIPSILLPLLNKRKEVRFEMSKLKKNSREYNSLWIIQYSIKIICNAFYGVLGHSNFRLYKRDCANAITYIARRIIKEVYRWFEEKGCKVIAGDTDSAGIEMGNKSIDDMINLINEINEYFKTYFIQFGIKDENNIFKLEFEKVFKTLFFKVTGAGKGAKKKYAGLKIWENGESCEEVSITGFESVRSDSPQIGRDFLKEILKKICYENSKEEIDNLVEEFRNKILKGEFTAEELGLPIGITKHLSEYGNQIHIRASRVGNELHNLQIKRGDKVKYVYIKHPKKVIAWKSSGYMSDGYLIDYVKMCRRICDLKVGPLYESLGWRYKYKTKESKREPKLSEIYKQLGLWN